MHVFQVRPTFEASAYRIGPRVEDDAADADGRATMRSARALVREFERGEIAEALLVRDLRVEAFRFFLIDPMRRALRLALARLHR